MKPDLNGFFSQLWNRRAEKKGALKKRVTALLLAVVMAALAGGCGDTTGEAVSEKKNLKIGVSVYNQHDTFLAELLDCFAGYAKEKENEWGITITLDIQNAGSNQVTQNDQMDYFIDRGCDVVCINLVDRTDASTIIERGKSADIPIIFFNRELVEEDLERWDGLYYVGADAFESGTIQGNLLVDKLKEDFDSVDTNGDGRLQYVMLEGEAGHQDSIVRTMYAINTVTAAGYQVDKLADEIANWNRDQASTRMTQWLESFGSEIEVVFANNDDMALGALDALKEAGYFADQEGKNPLILGIDGTKPALEAVKSQEFLGTVLNDSRGQAKGMLELANYIINGDAMEEQFELIDGKYIRMPYQKITIDNVGEISTQK